MFKFITPFVLIAIAVATLFMFTNPLLKDISSLRAQSVSYNEALTNSKALENERDKLTSKYNAINPDNLIKIQKLLPDNIDNIRLILEIGKIASPHGMILKNVKYNVVAKEEKSAVGGVPPNAIQGGGGVAPALNKDYGVWDLEFSTDGTYNNFLNFLKDLESNLRIVDISSIAFSSDIGTRTSLPDYYSYNFKIKTYWLKN